MKIVSCFAVLLLATSVMSDQPYKGIPKQSLKIQLFISTVIGVICLKLL